jgi:hypothetical protein
MTWRVKSVADIPGHLAPALKDRLKALLPGTTRVPGVASYIEHADGVVRAAHAMAAKNALRCLEELPPNDINIIGAREALRRYLATLS